MWWNRKNMVKIGFSKFIDNFNVVVMLYFIKAILMPIDIGLCATVAAPSSEATTEPSNVITTTVQNVANENILASITWAHAVNSWAKLNETLKSDIKMIEADVTVGKHKADDTQKPIMAHGPNEKESDLSLEEFLNTVIEFNKDKKIAEMKGIKLDYKSIDAFLNSTEMLEQKITDDIKFAVWLNADILPGPVKPGNKPVNATQFLQGAAKFPKLTLSVGWTTAVGINSKGKYTQEHVTKMIETLKENNVLESQHPITFPVRANYAAHSNDTLKFLLEQIERATLTIWSGEKDNVDAKLLREFVLSLGLDKVYVDVPKDLYEKLNLFGKDETSSASTLANFGLLSMAMLFAHRLF